LQKRFLLTAFLAASLLVIGYSCTKFDTTTQGADLVTVDNINTFDTTLDINANQGFFANVDDSTIIRKNETHVIGKISNDPYFGITDAAIYVQFKPIGYPFYFGNAGDTVKNSSTGMPQSSPNAGYDSAFVCLSYRGAYGDTTAGSVQNQTFQVYGILDPSFRDKTDTLRPVSYQPNLTGATLYGSANITPQIVQRRVKLANGKDSVENQIRIKLTGAGDLFAKNLFNGQDSTAAGTNNAFFSDEKFRKYYDGFQIKVSSTSGNTLYYVNLADAKSRFEFHFHKTKNGLRDTVVQSFQMYTTNVGTSLASPSANYIKRDYSSVGGILSNPNYVYLQTSPGTYASLKIPALSNLSNRIIHRAYLIVEQDPSTTSFDDKYTPPANLYLDLKDTSRAIPQRYKPLYFDLSNGYYNPDAALGTTEPYFPANNVSINYFGGDAAQVVDATGTFYRYELNMTRYVQHIVTNGYKNYDLRLYAPAQLSYPQYDVTRFVIPYYNPVALGRVRVASGVNIPANPHRMRLRIIYSKVQ
jgi:Domain of unknown function (DUF4270)